MRKGSIWTSLRDGKKILGCYNGDRQFLSQAKDGLSLDTIYRIEAV